jgi:hypothetical protein
VLLTFNSHEGAELYECYFQLARRSQVECLFVFDNLHDGAELFDY